MQQAGGAAAAAASALTPEERRALAIEKLARLFGGGTAAHKTPAEAERGALLEVRTEGLAISNHETVSLAVFS